MTPCEFDEKANLAMYSSVIIESTAATPLITLAEHDAVRATTTTATSAAALMCMQP